MGRTKKNANGTGTIRKRADGRWEARYSVGTDQNTGKPIQRSIYRRTQKEVREELSQITTDIDDGTYIAPSNMTISKWFEVWLEEYMFDKKWSTVKTYKAQIKKHILPALGDIQLSNLDPHRVQSFYNGLLRGGLSPKSVRNVHGILSKCLSIAVRLEYIKRNPTEMTTLPRVQRKEISPLTDSQVQEMVSISGNDGYGFLLKVVMFTGLRLGEAIGLTWDCVDFSKQRLTINKQLQKRPLADGGFTFTPLKNDKPRIIAPAKYVLDSLKQRQQLQIEDRLRAGSAWVGWRTQKEQQSALVFTNELGGNLHPQTVYNHFKKLAAQIGAPDARVHDLRHTYAVLSLQNGDDVKTVQGNLGHATAAFTLDVYGHVSERMKMDSADRMQRYIENL